MSVNSHTVLIMRGSIIKEVYFLSDQDLLNCVRLISPPTSPSRPYRPQPVTVYLSLSGMAPAYLAADCQLVSDEGRRLLRSTTSRTCVVRRSYSNYGERCFAAAGPRLWNSLPADLRQADISFEQFKRLLKTFLFGCWDRGAL